MTYYKNKYKNNVKEFPNAEQLKDKILCLPIYPTMNTKQIDYVINQIKEA
jgi:dTDP-4-amino-4,6-dideoxygalactose transaminase